MKQRRAQRPQLRVQRRGGGHGVPGRVRHRRRCCHLRERRPPQLAGGEPGRGGRREPGVARLRQGFWLLHAA